MMNKKFKLIEILEKTKFSEEPIYFHKRGLFPPFKIYYMLETKYGAVNEIRRDSSGKITFEPLLLSPVHFLDDYEPCTEKEVIAFEKGEIYDLSRKV